MPGLLILPTFLIRRVSNSTRFLISLIHDGFFEDFDSDVRVAHRALLCFLLECAREPLHQALVMQNVPTGGDFSHFAIIVEHFHANDTLKCVELVQFFVFGAVLDHRNKLIVAGKH